jgi:hypothetical protein
MAAAYTAFVSRPPVRNIPVIQIPLPLHDPPFVGIHMDIAREAQPSLDCTHEQEQKGHIQPDIEPVDILLMPFPGSQLALFPDSLPDNPLVLQGSLPDNPLALLQGSLQGNLQVLLQGNQAGIHPSDIGLQGPHMVFVPVVVQPGFPLQLQDYTHGPS